MHEEIKILVIEDNEEIQDSIDLIFLVHWPEAMVKKAFNGSDGIKLARDRSPDIILLDLGLPDIDGMKVLREIRSFSNIPVIILTVRGEEMDKIRGLELGADDYIVKPFTHKELLARLKTTIMRSKRVAEKKVEEDKCPVEKQTERVNEEKVSVEEIKSPVVDKNIAIDFNSGIIYKGDQQFKLSSTELNLVKCLASSNGKALSSEEILTRVWGEEYIDSAEYLQAYIHRLREKIESDANNPKIIISEQNGYKFLTPEI